MLNNLMDSTKEEKVKKLQAQIQTQFLGSSVHSANPIAINWIKINPILYKLVDNISWMSDSPSYLRMYVEDAQVKNKPFACGSYDMSDVDEFIKSLGENDITFYSLMELDGVSPPRIVLRCVLEPNPQKILQRKREERIKDIMNSFVDGDFHKILTNYKNITEDLH